jgi:hypothetical protein
MHRIAFRVMVSFIAFFVGQAMAQTHCDRDLLLIVKAAA